MTKAEITLSLVVATYNVAPYLEPFLDSIAAQEGGLEGVEVIVVNDGSTDGSGALADAWAARHPGLIRVLHQDNQGVCAARNAGLDQAQGDWVVCPDPDDRLSADFIAAIRAEIAQTGADRLVAVVSNLMLQDDATGAISDSHRLNHRFAHGVRRVDSTDPGPDVLAHTHSTAIKRADLNALTLRFDPRVRPSFEDAVLLNRLLLNRPGQRISFLPQPVYYYRQRSDASSLTGGAARHPDWYTAHLRHGYLPLLHEAQTLRGHVPRFVQLSVLVSLTAKLGHMVSPRFDPAMLPDPAAFKAALAEVMALIDADTLRAPGMPGFRLLQGAALLARFKGAQAPVRHANLVPAKKATWAPPTAGPGVWLRWQSGGADPVALTAHQGAKAAPGQAAFHDATLLLGDPYIQTSRLWVPVDPAGGLALQGPTGPVPIRFRGQPLAPDATIPKGAVIG